MKVSAATERLLPGEVAEFFTTTKTSYGRSWAFTAFGWRAIVDLGGYDHGRKDDYRSFGVT